MSAVNEWNKDGPDYPMDDDTCDRCGGGGWIMACDGDASDWGEDTYCGDIEASIECRYCRGTGILPDMMLIKAKP